MKFPIVLLVLLLAGCNSTPKRDDYTQYVAKPTASETISGPIFVSLDANKYPDFRGVYDADNTIANNSMLYQGGAGGAGVLAQILTHAAVNSSAQKSKLAEQQKKANKVLQPILPALENIGFSDLVYQHEDYVFAQSDAEGTPAIKLQSDPIFFFSKDLKSLTLKHVVKATKPSSKKPFYQNIVEVVGSNIQEDPVLWWTDNEAQRLRDSVKHLYQLSLRLAAQDIKGQLDAEGVPQRNHRFYQGGELRIERGTELKTDCESRVIRNLRGWLVVYPIEETGVSCQAGL